MSNLRLAFISVHSSPLARTGGKDTGGMGIYIQGLSRELGRRGINVDIFTRRTDPLSPEIIRMSENVRIVNIKSGPLAETNKDGLFEHLPEFLSNLLSFTEAEDIRYHLVHSHYWLSGWVGRVLHQQWRIAHIAMFHTLGAVKNQASAAENETKLRIETERGIIGEADYLVAASLDERKQLLRLYNADHERIEVIPCGIDASQFRPLDKDASRRSLGFPERKLVLFVGRIEPLKGIDLLLGAVGGLEDARDLRVVVIGGDSHSVEEIGRLRGLAGQLGIGDRVNFLGAIEHDKLPLYYSAATVCVVPSYYESFGIAALEALACGTPVIASKVGGLDDIIHDGETGYLIPWHCPEPFAERLELLLGNERLQRTMGEAAHAFARDFTWSAIAERILALYNKALAGLCTSSCQKEN